MSNANITTNEKAKFYIGTIASDRTADAYEEVLGAESVNPSTPVGGEQEVKDIELFEGKVQYGGSVENGTVEVSFALDKTDAGQTALIAARHDNLIYNFKLVKANGDTMYIKARVTAAGEVEAKGSDVVMGVLKLVVDAWL